MPAPPFPTNLLLRKIFAGTLFLASASQADPVRGRAPATERAKRSGAVRRYSLVAAKPSGPPLRSSRLDRSACVSSSHKSFADAKSLREPCLLKIYMQESPSGMASASQADPGGFDSRFLLHMNKGHSFEGRMLLCLFDLAEGSTSAAEVLPFPAPTHQGMPFRTEGRCSFYKRYQKRG